MFLFSQKKTVSTDNILLSVLGFTQFTNEVHFLLSSIKIINYIRVALRLEHCRTENPVELDAGKFTNAFTQIETSWKFVKHNIFSIRLSKQIFSVRRLYIRSLQINFTIRWVATRKIWYNSLKLWDSERNTTKNTEWKLLFSFMFKKKSLNQKLVQHRIL